MPRISLNYIENKIILTNKKGIKNMSKKEIIKKGVELYNKHFPNDKHITDKEKKGVVEFFIKLNEITKNNTDLVDRTIKVLKSKVNTYEADIDQANRKKLRTANDLKGSTKLF